MAYSTPVLHCCFNFKPKAYNFFFRHRDRESRVRNNEKEKDVVPVAKIFKLVDTNFFTNPVFWMECFNH